MASAPETSSSAVPVAAVPGQPSTDISDALAASIITQVSPNSPNPGAKPSRPSKSQRQPKAKRKQDESTDAAAGAHAAEGAQEDDEDEAAAVGEQVDGEQRDGSEDTTASSLTKSVNTAPGGPGASSAQVDSKPSPTPSALTADQSSTLKSTDATAAKPPAASASSPATINPPPRSTTTANNTARPKSQTKKGGLSGFFLACIPCISSNAHDDTPANARRPTTTASTSTPTPAANTSSNKEKADAALNEKTPDSTASTTKSSSLTPLPTDLSTEETEVTVPPPTSTPLPSSGVVLSQEETEGVTSGAVMAPGKEAGAGATPGKTRRRRSGKAPESIITQVPEPGAAHVQDSSEEGTDESEDEDEEDEEQSLIARGGVGIPIGEDGLPHPLLDELAPELKGRKCLVLDLDETLVHSSFKMVHQADYVVPVEIENQYHNVYVIKRPGVDAFLKAMGEIYEVVIFTASLSKYADPVLDQLDIHRVVQHRLFRESCYNNKGNYVKDLSQLGRPMSECIIIDNSPASYVFHVNNAVPISSWFNDPHDTELTDLVPFLTDLGQVDDIRSVLDAGLYQQLQF